jgi:hypothetical protein
MYNCQNVRLFSNQRKFKKCNLTIFPAPCRTRYLCIIQNIITWYIIQFKELLLLFPYIEAQVSGTKNKVVKESKKKKFFFQIMFAEKCLTSRDNSYVERAVYPPLFFWLTFMLQVPLLLLLPKKKVLDSSYSYTGSSLKK